MSAHVAHVAAPGRAVPTVHVHMHHRNSHIDGYDTYATYLLRTECRAPPLAYPPSRASQFGRSAASAEAGSAKRTRQAERFDLSQQKRNRPSSGTAPPTTITAPLSTLDEAPRPPSAQLMSRKPRRGALPLCIGCQQREGAVLSFSMSMDAFFHARLLGGLAQRGPQRDLVGRLVLLASADSNSCVPLLPSTEKARVAHR